MVSGFRLENYSQINRIGNFAAVGNGVLLAATGVSSNVQFPALPDGSVATDAMIVGDPATAAYVTFGPSNAVTAAIPTAGVPANGIRIPAGAVMVLDKGFSTFVAGITASGTANLYIYQGMGS